MTKKILTSPMDMRPHEIRFAMMQAGVHQAEVARELDVSQNSVHLIIEGKAVSDRIRRKIAEKIGLDIARIWPSVYLYGGPRKPGRPYYQGRKAA
jgi:lambda repressor-like predicted transcriptional regulator